MIISKIVDAVRNNDASELVGDEKLLANNLRQTLSQTSSEFHEDMLLLFENIKEDDAFVDLVTIVNSLSPQERIQLIALITTGDATDKFMKSLDTNLQLQRAVDIAFAGHIGQLHDLGQALNDAKDFI